MPGRRLSKSGSLEPEPEHQHPGSEKETMEQRGRPLTLTQIEFRMQQLNSRRLLLLEIQRCKKEVQNSEETIEAIESTQEDSTQGSEELSELMTIQKELDELLVLKEDLDRKGKRFVDFSNNGQKEQTSYKGSPRGGIYMLPFFQPNQDDAPAAQRPPERIVPSEILGRKAELTQCPFCEEVVVTEIHSQRGGAMWITCFLCLIMGCVAGCCLIPFCMKRLRNIQHVCPECHANIHTHKPL